MEKILTLTEIAEKLRVSRHTVQAWMSPSSPNHKPEFAALARHSGRKTVFIEEEIEAWLNQRKGAMYSQSFTETSAYWRERFNEARGIFKDSLKLPEIKRTVRKNFSSGKLALDFEPLMLWLTDSPNANAIQNIVNRAEGLVVAIPIAWWLLRRVWKNTNQLKQAKKFLIEDNIFELAAMNEDSLSRSFDLPTTAGELSIQSYSCCAAAGASSLLTCNPVLLKTPGLLVSSL